MCIESTIFTVLQKMTVPCLRHSKSGMIKV